MRCDYLLRVRRVLATYWFKTGTRSDLGEKKRPWPHLPNSHDELGIDAHRAAIETLHVQIERIERTVLESMTPRKDYRMLLTVDGIGPGLLGLSCSRLAAVYAARIRSELPDVLEAA